VNRTADVRLINVESALYLAERVTSNMASRGYFLWQVIPVIRQAVLERGPAGA
jgi:hypothetical protein